MMSKGLYEIWEIVGEFNINFNPTCIYTEFKCCMYVSFPWVLIPVYVCTEHK